MSNACAVILAAGRGERLRPLTDLVPKPLCPIGTSHGLERALARLAEAGFVGPNHVAVNTHHLSAQVVRAVGNRATISHETRLLGTAGAIGNLAPWIAGRDVVICNSDAYLAGDTPAALLKPNPERVRLLAVHDPERADFGELRFAGISYLPAAHAKRLRAEPSGLYEEIWRAEYAAGQVEFIKFHGVFIDCGTPADYRAANLHAFGKTTE